MQDRTIAYKEETEVLVDSRGYIKTGPNPGFYKLEKRKLSGIL